MDPPDRTEAERRLDRVLRAADAPGLLAALTERLSPTDLQTLLLETYRHRAAAVTPSRLLAAYEENRFATPSDVEPGDLARFEVACHERLAERGFVADLRVAVTDLTGGRHRTALRDRVLDRVAAEHPRVTVGFDDDRQHGVGYHVDACFEIHARMPDGEQINVVDGGLTRWTAALLDNAKERLAISGAGVERLLAEFRPGP